mgnify:CR=1 FL=1
MKKYNVYGMGAALVDTEIEVDDAFLGSAGIDKGVMTLVDEARQDRLLELLSTHLVASRRASGGSAANSVIATSCFGGSAFYPCKVADDENGRFYLADLARAGVDCNVCGGTFAVAGQTLTVGPNLACTRAACPTMAFETLYTSILSGDLTVEVSGNTLVLSSARGRLAFTQ